MTDVDKYGFESGSLRSKAAALYEKGATREEVTAVIGSTSLAVLTELKQKGYTIHKKRVRVGKNRPHYKYTIGERRSMEET